MEKAYNIKEPVIHLSVWLCFSIIPIITAFVELNRIPGGLIIVILLLPLLFYTNYFILVPKFLLKKRVILYVVSSILFLGLFNYIMIKVFPGAAFNRMHAELVKTDQDIPFIKEMKYIVPLILSVSIFLLGGIFALVIDFYKRERESKELESTKKEMEIQFLRAQMNPHFLFNSLNSIYSLVRKKSDDAPEAVITLSELMRYMLYEVGKEKVPLEKEMNYIKNYIVLQRLRLKNTEDVTLNIHGQTQNLLIYPLILITFIENAFKFGTDYKGNTHIEIQITITNNTLNFKIKNIIGVYKKDMSNSGVGLKNVIDQLNYLYPNKHALEQTESKDYYLTNLTLNL